MNTIDELQAKVKELEHEKRIAELQLRVAQLEAEIAALKMASNVVYVPYFVYPPSHWREPYYVTWSAKDSTGYITYNLDSYTVSLSSETISADNTTKQEAA